MITWLINLYTAARERARIEATEVDVDAKCPACGHCEGSLKLAATTKGPMIEHTCAICGAKFYEDTVVAPEKWLPKTSPAEKQVV